MMPPRKIGYVRNGENNTTHGYLHVLADLAIRLEA